MFNGRPGTSEGRRQRAFKLMRTFSNVKPAFPRFPSSSTSRQKLRAKQIAVHEIRGNNFEAHRPGNRCSIATLILRRDISHLPKAETFRRQEEARLLRREMVFRFFHCLSHLFWCLFGIFATERCSYSVFAIDWAARDQQLEQNLKVHSNLM